MISASIIRATGQGTVFVPLGERRIQESIRGLGWVGIRHTDDWQTHAAKMSPYWRRQTSGRQTHLGISEADFPSRYTEVVGESAKFVYDNRIRVVSSFGADGYDGHPGHKLTNMLMWDVVDEVNRLGHEVEVHELNSSHAGELRYAATESSRYRRIGAMGWHATQYYIDPNGAGSYGHQIMVAGHAVRSDTWAMLAGGRVLESLDIGDSYDIH